MANIKFLVRGKAQEKASTIYVSSRFGRDEKLMYATPLKVKPSLWDDKKQRVKIPRIDTSVNGEKLYPEREEVNAAVTAIEAMLKTFVADSVREGKAVTKESLKEKLDIHFGKKKETAFDFHSFFDYYIDLCDTRLNEQRGGQHISYKGKREYARTLYYIKEYEKEKKVHLEFEDIDQNFYDDFVKFLQGLNLATNTIGNKITYLKALMEAAYKRELTENIRYKSFRGLAEESDSVALNEDELSRIAKCNLSRHPKLEKVRDMFIVGSWTGLRFSDVTQILPENINDGLITIRQQKTDKNVVIPVHSEFKRIWDSYGGKLPRSISNQKFNAYLKLVCKAARLRTKVQKSITKGGKRIVTTYEKWELVSSHTARRSFATNLYRSGFPTISIMAITGHRTEAAFLKYIKVSREEHAELLAKHWQKMSK